MRPLPRLSLVLFAVFCPHVDGADLEVMITPELGAVEVLHAGEKVVIQRNQDREHTVNPGYAYTSRKCPPFCIQPMVVAPGVETVGELEVLHYLQRIAAGDPSILVVDARTPEWPRRGTIPGSVNVPWTSFSPQADPAAVAQVLSNRFGARRTEDGWDFSGVKTLVLFCNGMWCAQSTNSVQALLALGYPAEKLKWYRGGMQDWEILGLTTVKFAP